MRLFIIDPICCQEKGHNLASLYKYWTLFSKHYKEISLHVSNSKQLQTVKLPEGIPQLNLDFSLYYLKYIPLPSYEPEERYQLSLTQDNYVSEQINKSLQDVINMFSKYCISQEDCLFFPSVDFFSLYSLLSYLLDHREAYNGLTLTLRWIGVMENAANHPEYTLKTLFKLLKKCQSFLNIILTAESSVYSRLIENELNRFVINTPVPPDHDIMPMNFESNCFKVVFPGSARPDKGFKQTSEIISRYLELYPDDNVVFISQSTPPHEITHHEQFANKILSNPNSALYPSDLAYRDLLKLFESSHLICMPYAKDIYQFRSSAILTESCGYGRLVVTSTDTGFSHEVEYFGLGKTCDSIDKYCKEIHRYYSTERDQLFSEAKNARKRFQSFCDHQYRTLVSEMIKK